MTESKFVLIDADDWQGLYVDGKLVYEGHRVEMSDLASAANLNFKKEYAEGAKGEWLHENGNLPNTLDEWDAIN